MRVRGEINGQSVGILVDSGSTRNFVQKSLLEKWGCQTEKVQDFRVYIGSGEFLICNEVCRGVEILCQGTQIKADLFVLLMEGANVVLGVQ